MVRCTSTRIKDGWKADMHVLFLHLLGERKGGKKKVVHRWSIMETLSVKSHNVNHYIYCISLPIYTLMVQFGIGMYMSDGR